jgi:molybdopterin-guanine dinucleotide biosynthesis protein A
MSRDVAAIILAGGEGRRIGGAKPLRHFRGERLIDRAVRQAGHWSDAVAVAVRDSAQVQPIDARIIVDQPNVMGPLGGLVSALSFAAEQSHHHVLTIPADMPFLPRDLLTRLDSEIGQSGCAIASSGGHLHPVCGLWRTAALDQVSGYLAGGQRSLRGFAAQIGMREVEWESAPLDPFFNINSAEELAEAEQRAEA